jgi:hypothetical protein
LGLEIEALRSPGRLDRWFGRLVPLVTAAVAVGGFWWGIYSFIAQNRQAQVDAKQREDDRIAADRNQARLEATRPFWEKQVQLYLDAAEAAATIATDEGEGRKKAIARFKVLYYGPLAAVEDVGRLESQQGKEVEKAMVLFRHCLDNADACNQEEIKQRALALSRAIRDVLKPAFSPSGDGRSAKPGG